MPTGGGMWLGKMKTGQDNTRTQLWAVQAELKTSEANELHALLMIMIKFCFFGLSI